MLPNEISLTPELQELIHSKLCEVNDFQLGAFEITERQLVRKGNPCGVYFCLHGPRSVKMTAIWESENNTVLFYGSRGERITKLQLDSMVALAKAG